MFIKLKRFLIIFLATVLVRDVSAQGIIAYCCSSLPCQNGGTCYQQSTGYVCACLPGYTGVNCQAGEAYLEAFLASFKHLC